MEWIVTVFSLTVCNLFEFGASYQCYSCMSEIYGFSFKTLQHQKLFLEPETFSDACDNIETFRQKWLIGVHKDCHSTCVTLKEAIPWAGTGFAYIKGCYDRIFRNGFSQLETVSRMRYLALCRPTNMTTLVKNVPTNWQDSKVDFCSCTGDYCNANSMHEKASAPKRPEANFFSFSVVHAALFFLSYFMNIFCEYR